MISLLLAAAVTAPPQRFVISIGHNGPPDAARAALRHADDDAARFYELVAPGAAQAVLLTTFDADSQKLFGPLIAGSKVPTLKAVEDTVAEIQNKIEKIEAAGGRTELYFFYAGHGDVADGEGYVQLADGRLTRERFRRAVVEGGRAGVTHVIIDACKSYFMVAGRGPGARREPYAQPFVGRTDAPTVGYILSTSNDAESHEWAALAGGIVSHEVRSALAGAADTDLDGQVDYSELAAFVAAANEGIPVARYRPRVHVRPPPRDRSARLLATATLPGRTLLRLPPAAAGRVSLTDERGLRYVDTHKQAGSPLSLALVSPRRYEVQVGSDVYSVQATGTPVELASLTPETAPMVAARGEAHRAFERLFEHPFDADVVRGYKLASDLVEPEVVEPQSNSARWWVLGGAAALASGALLVTLAADEYSTGARAPQADRPGHEDRAAALGWGAGGAFLVGLGVLGVGLVSWE